MWGESFETSKPIIKAMQCQPTSLEEEEHLKNDVEDFEAYFVQLQNSFQDEIKNRAVKEVILAQKNSSFDMN